PLGGIEGGIPSSWALCTVYGILLSCFALEHGLHRLAHVGGTLDAGDARRAERVVLRRGGAFPALDDRAGVAHALARGRGLAADERDDRLLHVRLDPGGRLLFHGAADFADHDHRASARVLVEQIEAVDEVRPLHGVAADADRARLPVAERRELPHGFVG